ncbi:salicylaldehyde dehydrogenase [Piedraia hortae CBS 480.64]|uniref:Salicylaldehyde dehydrogenase n=1 Tax=Piedraia hortae CBS 480.64 TaxID=1314780 RepID=A0A6A7BPK4_9PEZI|nr:salicylaldehyde dehydrogenase [Piedraia hortae CBS 480.64]
MPTTKPDMSTVVPLWIDGKEVTEDTHFDVVAPSTAKPIWSASSASPASAICAVEAAGRAFDSWRKTKPAEIRTIFLRAADIFDSRRDELASYMRDETGAAQAFIDFNLNATPEIFRDLAGRAANISGTIPPTQTPGQAALVFKVPLGVILGIAPWNAPLLLGARAVLYAIAGGNTVVLKGSELCPRTFWALGSVMHDAGIPPGVLNVLFCRTNDAATVVSGMIEHRLVRKVNFTGSTAMGSIIASQCGKHLKPALMELGGKSPAIVCQDANIEEAARSCAVGAMLHAGQICMSTERIIVHRKVLDSFRTALTTAVLHMYSNDGTAPLLVGTAAVEKNRKLLADAASKGSQPLVGKVEGREESAYQMRPVIMSGVTPEMDMFHTESFGPTASLIPVQDDDEAIKIANDTAQGLSSAIFTTNLGRGLRLAQQLQSGAVHINSMSVHDEVSLPHGGIKDSGWGRFNGQWGIDEFMTTKTVTFME